jgi:hypothetical protein
LLKGFAKFAVENTGKLQLAVSPTLQTQSFELVIVKDRSNSGPGGTFYSLSYQVLGFSQIGWLLT